MTTVAVTGVNRPVGRALLERLDADPGVTRIIGVDGTPPRMPVAKLDFRGSDIRDRLLAIALQDVDVLVHLALDMEPTHPPDTLFARNVHGTRNVLAAAADAGVPSLVHLSHGMVYGAHPDNPVPITEDAPLRANPDYAPAYQALLAEELVAEFGELHPDRRTAILRPASVLGLGVEGPLARQLDGLRILGVGGYTPPLQVVHVDDVAAALALAVTDDLRGAYNVAADGWLAMDEVCAILGRRRVDVPEGWAFGAVASLWDRGLWTSPPGLLHFIMHPWVLATVRLRGAGWAPRRSNREVLREFAAERSGWVRVGPVCVRRRTVTVAAVTSAAVAGGTVWRLRSRQT